ncbi:MAG: hydroxymethylbilane synthase [Anaerolineae bacterium]
MTVLRIGTRRSQLALWQTHHVRDLLRQSAPDLDVEIVYLTTAGDRVLDRPLPEIGGKGLFTQELEEALRQGTIDLAVHSLKDLPTELAPEFALGAILRRANPFDALISRAGYTLDTLPANAVVGTSSLRRRAQLLAYRPDLQTHDLRGNVDTRLRKAFESGGSYDAIVLAVAGLERLGRLSVASQILPAAIMLPAPAQGAIAVQCRANDERVRALLAPLDDPLTRAAVSAERAFLSRLDAGCRLPVSALATIQDDTIQLMGRVNALDGSQTITVQGQALLPAALDLGARLAAAALAQGAAALLEDIRRSLPT